MEFPETNKQHIDRPTPQQVVGENAKLLEEILRATNWKYLITIYFLGIGIFLATLFALIVTVKGALLIF